MKAYLILLTGFVKAFISEFQVIQLSGLSVRVGMVLHCTVNTHKCAVTPADIHSMEGYKGLLSTNSVANELMAFQNISETLGRKR